MNVSEYTIESYQDPFMPRFTFFRVSNAEGLSVTRKVPDALISHALTDKASRKQLQEIRDEAFAALAELELEQLCEGVND